MNKHGRSAWIAKACTCDYCHEAMRIVSERNNRKAGMKPTTKHEYTLNDIKLLMDMSLTNQQVAKMIGVSDGAVRVQRKSMGIRVHSPKFFTFTAEQIEVLHEATSNEVCARKLGLAIETVAKGRDRRGITSVGRKSNYRDQSGMRIVPDHLLTRARPWRGEGESPRVRKTPPKPEPVAEDTRPRATWRPRGFDQ